MVLAWEPCIGRGEPPSSEIYPPQNTCLGPPHSEVFPDLQGPLCFIVYLVVYPVNCSSWVLLGGGAGCGPAMQGLELWLPAARSLFP